MHKKHITKASHTVHINKIRRGMYVIKMILCSDDTIYIYIFFAVCCTQMLGKLQNDTERLEVDCEMG